MQGVILRTEKLNAGYGKMHIIFDVSLDFPEKRISVIVGPNGSGKSTLLKTIFGLTKIISGKIILRGMEITGKPPHEIAKMGIAYLPQTQNVFDNLTVQENLVMAGYSLSKEEAKEKTEEVLEIFPILRAYMKQKAGRLSGGEKQMLAMAMALMRTPEVLMFDEPTAALSPKIAHQIINIIRELNSKNGKTIILVEQNARLALEISDFAVVMSSGKVVYNGDGRKLLEDPELGLLYLGLKTAPR
ncbi:MAG: ABC transporter ATP-binding protein [Fervidicoccaceae archaeon]|jgi:branched-chain amino acid transport system ATP-binding protein